MKLSPISSISPNAAILPIPRKDARELNLVLVWNEDKELVLIDAGLPGQSKLIAQAIADTGFRIEELTHIILTHQDLDHVGSVKDLMKFAPGLKVIAHEEEAPYIDGSKIPIKLAAQLEVYDTLTDKQKSGVDKWKSIYEANPIPVSESVKDKQILNLCGGIEVVHTPGHTPGHIALYLMESRVMVCGDAANIENGTLTGSNPIYTHDMKQADESLEKIKSYNVSGYITYHSGFLGV